MKAKFAKSDIKVKSKLSTRSFNFHKREGANHQTWYSLSGHSYRAAVLQRKSPSHNQLITTFTSNSTNSIYPFPTCSLLR